MKIVFFLAKKQRLQEVRFLTRKNNFIKNLAANLPTGRQETGIASKKKLQFLEAFSINK